MNGDKGSRARRARADAVGLAEARPAVAAAESLLLTHAGVVTRLLAAAVDAAAVVLLIVLLDLAAAGARFLWSPVDFRWPRPTTFVTVVALLLVAAVYLAIGWALAGRTYGGRLIGLRVLSFRHELLGWTRSVLRALTCVLWPLGLLWCGISRTRLSLADVMFRSVVVYDAQPYVRVRDEGPSKASMAPPGRGCPQVRRRGTDAPRPA